jgi:hypothetical protein
MADAMAEPAGGLIYGLECRILGSQAEAARNEWVLTARPDPPG